MPDHQRADVREYIAVLQARKWEVSVVTTVVAAAAVFFSARQTPIYAGEARVLVRPVQMFGSAISVQEPPNLDTERELVMSQSIAEAARRSLPERVSVDGLL